MQVVGAQFLQQQPAGQQLPRIDAQSDAGGRRQFLGPVGIAQTDIVQSQAHIRSPGHGNSTGDFQIQAGGLVKGLLEPVPIVIRIDNNEQCDRDDGNHHHDYAKT